MSTDKKHKNEILRIGIDIRDSKNPSGVGRYIRELINGLQSDKNIELYLFHDERKETLRYKISDNTRFEYLTTKHAWFWEQFWLPIILARLGIKVYHATNNKGLPWFNFGRRVLTIHDVIPLIYPNVIPKIIQRIRFIYTLRIDSKLAETIIADSESTKNDIVKYLGISPHKIKVIWPISLNVYNKKRITQKEKTLENVNWVVHSKYIVHNGGLDPRKNIPRLIDAYKIFTDINEYAQYKLIFTGRTNTAFARKMMAYAKSLSLADKVVFTGEINEQTLISLISKAEMCAYPSLYEGFGLPIIEAMQAGTPVITSNLSSMPEVAGGAALLVDPYNTANIVKAMIEIASNNKRKKTMIEDGFRWVKNINDYNMVELTKSTYCARPT